MTAMDVISAGSFFSPHRSIFLAIFLLHLFQKFIDHGAKRGAKTSELIQLRQEINQLLREANSLSTTFFLSYVEASSEEKNADYLVDVIEEHMKLVGVENIAQICTDNDSNYVLAGKKLMERPSTFAQAAKLRRMAASKEKELTNYQEGQNKEHGWPSCLSGRNLFFIKVVFCLWLTWKFWGVHVIVVPPRLLQPFGKMLSWSMTDPSTGLIPVGIIPWLLLSNQVSNVLCQKLFSVFHL